MNYDGWQPRHHDPGPGQDITPLPDLVHDAPRAGPVRVRRPVYLDLLPPCNAGCPAGENIQAWLADIQAGWPEPAWRQLVADNPLPAIHGRVCYHPCETVCNRAELDSPVSIHSVERYLGDLALNEGWAFDPPPPPTGQRVLVIGAGPSGLSAAYHLARLGHQVEIRDASPEPGGMMRYGIPAYRLPRDVIAAEIRRIEALGVTITCGHRVTDLAAERRDGRFDAVFVAVGAHLSKHVDIPARDASRIVEAVPFLREVASGGHPAIGRRVAVYGRREHRDGRRPDRAPPRRGRRTDRLPAYPGPDARPRRRGPGGRAGRRADQLAAHDHRVRRTGDDRRGHGTR
jgi:hypothetical protein